MRWVVSLLGLLVATGAANAQTAYGLHEKGIERLNEARKISPLTVDTVFGDRISHFDGGVSFSAVDIDVPGNDALPVTLRRTLLIDDRFRLNGHHLGAFAEWDLDLPRLTTEISTAMGWRPEGGSVSQRCSSPAPPPSHFAVGSEDYWGGYVLHIPGESGQQLLSNPSAKLPAAGGGPYPWITRSMWRVSCLPSTANGYLGEAFVALSPDGVRYTLNWVVVRNHAPVQGPPGSLGVPRQVVQMLVTRIEDRFGNSVSFTYSGDKLTGMSASDGRFINLNWAGNTVASATSSIGSWSYAYSGGNLITVARPDASHWQYASTGALAVYPPTYPSMIEDPTGCPDSLDPATGSYTLTVTAPSGAVGNFAFGVLQHDRSNIPDWGCTIVSPDYWYMKVPRSFWSLTLISRTVSGPGLPAMSWNYSYGSPNPLTDPDAKYNRVTGPLGQYERRRFGTGFNLNEGQLLQLERGTSAASIVRTESYTYASDAQASGQNFPDRVGNNPRLWADQLSSTWLRPMLSRTVMQDGGSFRRQVNSCGTVLCMDAFARPTSETRTSTNTGANRSRTDLTAYHDNTGLWVLGQVAKITNSETGIELQKTEYDAYAFPWKQHENGKLKSVLLYDTASAISTGQRGTLKTVTDGNGNTTTLSSWKRGIPQSIRFPATAESPTGATQAATVSDHGWITQVTDELGYSTNYAYDPMGRLSQITHPAGDSTAWLPTTIAFQKITASEYGIPAGHWRRTESTGNGRDITYYDGLWRPLVSERYDAANPTDTRTVTVQRFDALGRQNFVSYPQGTISAYSDALNGTITAYDPLDRPTTQTHSSELGTLTTTTQYLSGLKTKVTDPRGAITQTQYTAWDEPNFERPVQVSLPEDRITELTRDALGDTTQITRRNTAGTQSVTRGITYNAHREICKRSDPESGATLVGYDNNGNEIWTASGLPSATACDATGTNPATVARKISTTFDGRNRPTAQSFPDGRGNTATNYFADGQISSLTADNGGGNTVISSYAYNKRRLLTQETQTLGSLALTQSTTYAPTGATQSQTLPGGQVVDYAPNALGQPTQVGTFATGVTYFPNGAMKQFTYGNGIVHTLTQNVRGLPQRSLDADGATAVLDDTTGYDTQGNVIQITDGTAGNRRTRTMTYDLAARLKTTASPMYSATPGSPANTARYAYDAIDNLTQVVAPNRDWALCHDVSNRLASVKTGTCSGAQQFALNHDVQGNVISRAGRALDFDYGNRLRSVAALAQNPASTYIYDGWGRRVRDTTTSSRDTFYGKNGTLTYARDQRSAKVYQYIHINGSQVAEIATSIAGGTATATYIHTDALGTPTVKTSQSKAVIEKTEIEPYGNVLLPSPATDGPGYTGHLLDTATNLNYMQQRYYDPMLGQFLSNDPIYTDLNIGANFNRRWYANGNSYRFTDPDGRVGFLYWSSPNQVTYTVLYNMFGQSPQFSAAQFEAQVKVDFSGTVQINGQNVTITAQAIASNKGGPLVNQVNVVKDTAGVTKSGRSETNRIGGNKITLGAMGKDAASAVTASHEVGGHAGGAGDQYKGGLSANGRVLPVDIPGASNVMKDLRGNPANQQTLKEIISAPTNVNHCATGVKARNGGC